MTPVNPDIFYIEEGTVLEQHPLSACWPPIDPETFRDIVESVRRTGVRTPIVIDEDKILDGWHRYNAAAIVGVDCPAIHYEGDDPAGMVIEANQLRRHLSPRERAEAVLACRKWQPSGRPKTTAEPPPAQRPRTNDEIAREAGVSSSTVSRARNPQRRTAIQQQPDSKAEVNGPWLPESDPEPEIDDAGPVDDWQDFPDFAQPGTVGTLEDGEPNDEEISDAPDVSQPATEQPEAATDPPPAKRTVADQAQDLREDDLRRENADLLQRLALIDSPISEQEIMLENLQLEIKTTRSRLNDVVTENERLKRENAGLKRENDGLKERLSRVE